MRAGDLTNLPGGPVIDPTTGAPFPGSQIPKTQLNSVSQSLLNNYVPLPNVGNGVDTNGNYRLQAPTPAGINGYDVRIDQHINAKQQLYARWSWKNVDTTAVNQLLPSERDHEDQSQSDCVAQLHDSADSVERGTFWTDLLLPGGELPN